MTDETAGYADPLRLRFSLITGALGSGKTTLLNAMLRTPSLRDAFVLVNEFGDVGIDHTLIAEVSESVILLESGCACCAMTGDLRDELTNIVDQLAAETWVYGRHVILETTGLADPLPILRLLTSDEVLRDHFTIGPILTTVDVLRHYEHSSGDPSYHSQLALADILVFTKTRMASASDRTRASRMVEAANPLALAFEFTGSDAAAARAADALINGSAAEKPARVDGHPRRQRAHLHGVSAFTLTMSQPVDQARFLTWLKLQVQSAGEDVLRLKGAVAFSDGWYDVNGYGTILHTPSPVTGRDCALPGRLAVIVRGLRQAALQRGLDWACYGFAPERPSDARTLQRYAPLTMAPAALAGVRALLTPACIDAMRPMLRWNCHNPWSLAGQGEWAWPLLSLLESAEIAGLAAERFGGNLNLVSSEIITPSTYWLGRQGNALVADEGQHVPVASERCVAIKIALWGLAEWQAGAVWHDLTLPVAMGSASRDWAVLSVIYSDALAPFSREKDHPVNRRRAMDRPLEGLCSAPIWHVSGERCTATNYVRGFDRPTAEWAAGLESPPYARPRERQDRTMSVR